MNEQEQIQNLSGKKLEGFPKKIYLAGPDVFKPDAKEVGQSLCWFLNNRGMIGLFPLDNEIDFGPDKYKNGASIAHANRQMIHQCDAVLANLEPFRGPSADVGTVWECAYAKALGKFVVGYNVGRYGLEYKTKIIGEMPHDGMMVEDFGCWDNIMLVHGLDAAKDGLTEAFDALENLFVKEEKDRKESRRREG